jgi:hypothetical protein
LSDESRRALARVVPSTPWTDPGDWEDLGPPESDDESQRSIDAGEKTYTTQELMDEIKKMK